MDLVGVTQGFLFIHKRVGEGNDLVVDSILFRIQKQSPHWFESRYHTVANVWAEFTNQYHGNFMKFKTDLPNVDIPPF